MFSTPSSGFVYLVLIYLLFGLIANLFWSGIDVVMDITLDQNISFLNFASKLGYIVRCVPIFSVLFGYQKLFKANALLKLCAEQNITADTKCNENFKNPDKFFFGIYRGCCKNLCEGNDCFDAGSLSFGRYGAGEEILYLFLTGIISIALVILYDGNVYICFMFD